MTQSRIDGWLERLSVAFSKATASSFGFGVALLMVLLWCVSGPIFDFSPGWQNLFPTFATIVTFLMVFLVQRAQSKDVMALHLKLNELIASQQGAHNRLLNVEEVSEEELAAIRELHDKLPKDSSDAHVVEHNIDLHINENVADRQIAEHDSDPERAA